MHERAHYDRDALYAVLDAGLFCHVGYVFDGYPVVTPTLYWREGDAIYWHGSSASRMIRANEGHDVCLTVSHLDGIVLARSAFHHSANYRAAMLFGKARLIDVDADKLASLKAMMEGLSPGRWDTLRPVHPQELKATRVLWMPIDEASAKIRTGGPNDDAEDMEAEVWAGVVPIRTVVGEPVADVLNRGSGVPEISGRFG